MSKILLTTDTDLTAVADAIRAKNGTVKALVYPEDYIIGIRSISAASASGNSSISVSDAEDGDICSLTQYGVCEQDSSTNAISCNNGVLSISNGEVVATAANSETLTLGSQTATVENLYSVGSVRDEQEITTGRIIRKNAVCIYDETQNVGDRYLSSTGAKDNGAIVVYPMETEYNGQSNVTFTEDEIKDINLLEASISPIQNLHGYSNPWPAGGGKNILPPPTSATAGASGTITNDNGFLTISTTGENVTFTIQIPEFTFAASGQKIELLNSFTNGTVYFLNGNTQVDYFSLSSVNRVVSESSMSALKGKTINRYRITVNAQTLTNATFAMMVTDSSASALTSFSPYSNICPITGRTGLSVYVSPTQDPDDATTYAVDWTSEAGTVYGGTLDVVTGELVVDRGRVNVSSSWYWYKSSSYSGGFYATIENAGTGQKTNTPFICSHAKTATSISQYVQGTCFCDGSIDIRIMDGSDTVQDWKDYINAQITAGTPIQICYELATPSTYQLTPQEVTTLAGINNVFSSDGTSIKVAVSNPVIERVAPQPFTLNSGSNTISANNLSVSSVPLKIAYGANLPIYDGGVI